MKSTTLLILLFIGLASCHFRFFEPTPEDVGSKKNDISQFFTGAFAHFKLPVPTQIIDCFSNSNAGAYFNLIQELNKIFQDTKERSTIQLHLELIKLVFLEGSLKQTHACIMVTQDFTDFLETVGITKRDPEQFEMYLYLYYQAHYLALFEGFKPIIDHLNNNNNLAAGDAFGAVAKDVVSAINEEGLYHLAFAAFGNGAAITLGTDEPLDSLECYDKNSSRIFLEFNYKIALAVSEGSIKESSLNAYKFWKREGKDIMAQIPQSVFECEAQSNDIQKINTKLGVDISSEEFFQRMLKFINNNRFCYYELMTSMKQAFEHHNLHHAGSVHARFLKEIAKSTL